MTYTIYDGEESVDVESCDIAVIGLLRDRDRLHGVIRELKVKLKELEEEMGDLRDDIFWLKIENE